MFLRNKKNKKGITAVEAVVGVSIAALILTFTTHTIVRFIRTSGDSADKTQALFLAEEGLEFTRYIRDDAWGNISALTNGATNYIEVGASTITTTTTPEVIGQFTRSFIIEPIYRDSNDDIVPSTEPSATADTDSKEVEAIVTWGNPAKSVSLKTIVSNLHQ